MNVELTIQEMFDDFPTLFKERADCLNHLFCAIGNGFEWVDGELVDTFDGVASERIATLSARLIDGKAHQYNKLSLRAEARIYESERLSNGWYDEWSARHPSDDIEWLKAGRQRAIDALPDDVYYKEPIRKKRWYFYINIPGRERVDFCTRYAYLFNYPNNIKPDWKTALEECRHLLLEDGFELPKEAACAQ